MSTIERDLVKSINLGRAFALVGAGPSIEIGYPSWAKLASGAIELIEDNSTNEKVINRCKKHYINKEYPNVFSLVSDAIGYEQVIAYIEKEFKPKSPSGKLYSLLIKWPFCSYLTTNYDDQILRTLLAKNIAATEKLNSKEDMVLLRGDSMDKVFNG